MQSPNLNLGRLRLWSGSERGVVFVCAKFVFSLRLALVWFLA